MEEIRFTKMHGIGNDYIYINCMERCPDALCELSIEMSNRHYGIGGDGIILILPSDVADFKMRIFNADGSEAEMCGSASRCVGKYVYDKRLTNNTTISLETLSGIKTLELHVKDNMVDTVTVDMGIPTINAENVHIKDETKQLTNKIVQTSKGEVKIAAISMGNPHGVVFVDDLSKVDVHGLGQELETHEMWPERANIEFAQILAPNEIKMRVWERGSGETMACGTGACAVAVAGAISCKCNRDVIIHLLGGDLTIHWDHDNSHVYMTGDATTVYDGVYYRRKKNGMYKFN